MKKEVLIWGFVSLLLSHSTTYGQKYSVSLSQIMNEWCLDSPAAKQVKLSYENELLEFENYQKEFLPSIALTLNPINFNRSQRLLQHPEDGSYSYIEDYTNNSSTGLSVRQKVGITGGELTISSNLNYLREFSVNRNRFGTNPLLLNYSQQFLGGNYNYKKKRSIEYAKHTNSLKQFCSDMADVQTQAINMFLDVFVMDISTKISLKNIQISDTLLWISKALQINGHFTEYEYNQIELQNLNDKFSHENSLRNYQKSLRKLFSFLGKDDWINLDLEIMIPDFSSLPLSIDYTLASSYAHRNSPFALLQERKRLQAEQTLFSAKLNNRFNGSISINYGLNQFSEHLVEAYRNPDYSQGIMIGFQIPMFQWGTNRNKLRIAKNNYRNAILELDRANVDFSNNLKDQIDEFNHNMNLWFIAERAYKLSQKQYQILIQKFRLGKVSAYDISLAKQEQNEVLKKYYSSIQCVWNNFCTLRKITLYDFAKQMEINELLLSSRQRCL